MFDIQYHDNPALVLKPHPRGLIPILRHAPPPGSIPFILGAGALRIGPSSMEFSGPVRIQSGLEWFGSCLHYDVV